MQRGKCTGGSGAAGGMEPRYCREFTRNAQASVLVVLAPLARSLAPAAVAVLRSEVGRRERDPCGEPLPPLRLRFAFAGRPCRGWRPAAAAGVVKSPASP